MDPIGQWLSESARPTSGPALSVGCERAVRVGLERRCWAARWTELSASSGGEREEGKGEGELGCWRWTGPGRVVLGRGVGFGPECKGAGPRRKKGERAAVEVRWAELGLGCFSDFYFYF